MGTKKSDKSTVTVTTPPPSQAEQDAQRMSQGANELAMFEAGYVPNYDVNGNFFKWDQRPLTADEQASADRDRQLEDLIFSKLTGKISPEDAALVEETYGAALETGKSDMNAELARQLENLGIGEGRGYEDIKRELVRGTEDIKRSTIESAGSRGLNMSDTPIASEQQRKFREFGEDVNATSSRLAEDAARNKRILGEDFGRNLRNFETTLQGAKAGAMLDVGQRQQIFAENVRQFQAGLQQQAMMNRQMIGESFANTALGLGNLRSRNMTQTSSGSGSASGGASSIMGGVGGLMGGAGSLISAFSSSSREYKENIEPADIEQMLEDLEATPVYFWNYKGNSRRHIGPVTEEAPEIMVDGDVLVHIDYLGFLFGALKALNEKVKRLESR